MSGTGTDADGRLRARDLGAGIVPPSTRQPLRGVRVLVIALLLVFAAFSGVYTWNNVVRARTAHLGHLADLAVAGAQALIAARLHELDGNGALFRGAVGMAPGSDPRRSGWMALAVRDGSGPVHVLLGARPPSVVRAAPCATGAGCVVGIEAARDGRVGRLWLRRAAGNHTFFGAFPLPVITRLWGQFPLRAADVFDLRGPNAGRVHLWGGRERPAVQVWRAVGDSGLALAAGATWTSLREQWWRIVWPGAVFLVLVALAAEGALRGFERRALRAAGAVSDERARTLRARNLYAALSDTNHLIVRHPEPEALFAAACLVLVERAGVWAARIGWVSDPSSPDALNAPVQWVAWAARGPDTTPGAHCRPLEGVVVDLLSGKSARRDPGPPECARFEFCTGNSAQAVLPIRRGGSAAAVLWLCADAALLDEPEGWALLEEMALDLGFSLEEAAQRRDLEYAAVYDMLTGLANRRSLVEELRAAAQPGTAPGVLAVFYVEALREINATLGHAAGDEVLRGVAQRLAAAAKDLPGALAARGDGDRLFLMMPGIEPGEAEARVGTVQAALATPLNLSGGEDLRVQTCAGWVCWPEHWNGAAVLMGRAELALEAARASEPCQRGGFEPALEVAVQAARRVRREFEPALARGEVVLYYQPVLSLDSGRVEGFEALARWVQPDGTVRPPAAFLQPVEQDARLLRALGRFVLDAALSHIAAWADAGLAVDVSVNIGASHLSDPAFVNDLDAALAGHDPLVGRRLLIEITESAYLGAPDVAAAALEAARSRGVRTVLDDFGTAYASLSYLQALPVDRVKIDHSFTSRLLQGQREEAIVGGVAMIARLLGLDLVAEGVETDGQAELLRHLGCPKLQGYRIARPMPAGAVEQWLGGWDSGPWAHPDGGVLTPVLEQAEVLALALQDWVCGQALTRHGMEGEGSGAARCCAWLHSARQRSPFGRWLEGPGRKRYGGYSAFEALVSEQAALEREARVLAGARGGDGLPERDEWRTLLARYDALLRASGALHRTAR